MDPAIDTIYAPATHADAGGICIVRISGPRAKEVLQTVFSRPVCDRPRVMTYGHVTDGGRVLDECMAVFFSAPLTYTREDVAELHLHASPAGVAGVLSLLASQGLRLADPGEFTRRAFMNGRIDLSRAEAVMEFITAQTRAGAQAALSRMQGSLCQRIEGMGARVTDLLAGIALCVDYPEHDAEEAALEDVRAGTEALIADANALLDTAKGGIILASGLKAAICGRPNVGKSTLFNALLGQERAIVTSEAGTTRDAIAERIEVGGVMMIVTDTAGIREAEAEAERLGVERALRAQEEADLLLVVVTPELAPGDIELMEKTRNRTRLIAVNKCDVFTPDMDALGRDAADAMPVSAKTGQGVEDLKRAAVERVLGEGFAPPPVAIANHRQKDALLRARDALLAARNAAIEGVPPDLIAVDLTEAAHALGEITGRTVDEDVIERVFERFCVGK
ncbi:MAG: tRNA uridine-5-carboxymethylaminomethyl(34) synthesis GTPase MnmE [Clostridiales bacterium]|nr:tRNA uridine-5-carboxymethylaminomethyl(34) synthesis GTPase MnmE [Clostridiales bacterium]